MQRLILALTAVVVMIIGAIPAAAQSELGDLTESEITNRFQQQKIRGIVISPTTDGGAALSGVENKTATTVYQPIDPDIQVNVNIRFDFDSAALREDQKPKLTALCSVMRDSTNVFRIVGHTDAVGSADYNDRLSLLRAEEVKRYLVTDCGVPEIRLEPVGVGMKFPYDKIDPQAPVNRRVEFQLIS